MGPLGGVLDDTKFHCRPVKTMKQSDDFDVQLSPIMLCSCSSSVMHICRQSEELETSSAKFEFFNCIPACVGCNIIFRLGPQTSLASHPAVNRGYSFKRKRKYPSRANYADNGAGLGLGQIVSPDSTLKR
ncbi:Hypothetical protein NTJ_10053 [Nesidiocoris tenuis]|uniref:Uncharacterized protein n=1 Tax=Nesidiocoris tenuis TaxID=355587 RepID=A0ABN7AYI3_9HEMI|nr:Hypothetical protein NTJ_10053 [Nesidiocoris tenuis]